MTIENVGDETVYLDCHGTDGIEYWLDGVLVRSAVFANHQCPGGDSGYPFEPGDSQVRRFYVPYAGDLSVPDSSITYRVRVLMFKDMESATAQPKEQRKLSRQIDLEMQRLNEFKVIRVEEG